MPNLTDHITNKCDNIDRECDHIVKSVATVDTEIDRLNISAGNISLGLAQLAEAKAVLKRQRMTIFRTLFFSQVRPSAIKDRMSRILRPSTQK